MRNLVQKQPFDMRILAGIRLHRGMHSGGSQVVPRRTTFVPKHDSAETLWGCSWSPGGSEEVPERQLRPQAGAAPTYLHEFLCKWGYWAWPDCKGHRNFNFTGCHTGPKHGHSQCDQGIRISDFYVLLCAKYLAVFRKLWNYVLLKWGSWSYWFWICDMECFSNHL